MNREAAEVDRSILELLAPGTPLSKHTNTNLTNDNNFPDQVSNSQNYYCKEGSLPDTDVIIDEQQNRLYDGKNDTQVSQAISSTA